MAVGAEVGLAAPVVGDDVAGARLVGADDLQAVVACSALCTQVETAAQPPPGILCPACSSDQVTNDAHHGLPGETPAAARYWSTCGPVFAPPISCTPFWDWAKRSAAAPSELPPPPAERRPPRRPRPPAAGAGAARRLRGGRGRRPARDPQQPSVVELGLVAAAVLLGGAFDVGDPVAVLVRVVDRLAVGDRAAS